MNHPEILIVPILLLSDYFLTVLGAVLKEKGYDNFFKIDYYELNPIWQDSVAKKKWFNVRHLGLTALLTGVLLCLTESGIVPDQLINGLNACLMIFWGGIIGRHLSNILFFRRLIRRSEEISGQITMSHALSLAISLYQCLIIAVPLAFLVIFYPSPILAGAFIGSLLLIAVHLRWIRIYKRKKNRPTSSGSQSAGTGGLCARSS